MKTLYEVLDLDPDCDAEGVKEAFRRAAKVNHPDLNVNDPDATARFRQIVRAKSILSDPELRADYDRMLDFEHQQHHSSSRLGTALNVTHIVALAAAVAGAFTVFTYIPEPSVAKVKVTEDAAHQAVNVDVRSSPPSDSDARDKAPAAEASVPTTGVASASTGVEDVASAPSTAPMPAVQESAAVVDVQPPAPTNASGRDSHGDSVLSSVESSSGVPVESAASAPSVAATRSNKLIAAIHSDELTSRPRVKDANYYREQGVAAYHSGDIAVAIADFNLAIRLDPNLKKAYVDRGLAFYRIRKFDRAFADLARAIRIEKSR